MIDLPAIRARLEKAQESDSKPYMEIEDEKHISRSLQDIPALLEEIERLQKEIERMKSLIDNPRPVGCARYGCEICGHQR